MHQLQTAFENIVGKEEIARNEQFLLFPQHFLLNQIIVSPFVHTFDIISLFAAEFEEPKIGISGKGLKLREGIKLQCVRYWFGYFRLFIVATGCPSERRPQKTVSCYGG